ncbi:MAG: methyltransferase domain-containing protein [Ginsengibacter sp.]
MALIRKPFQGTWNIIRFNWHFYALSILSVVILIGLAGINNAIIHFLAVFLLFIIIVTTLISLAVSYYVYDFSDLYKLSWLDKAHFDQNDQLVNINAGFDETSILLNKKFSKCDLSVFDFYDPVKHTEVSIKRARKAYPSFPNTRQISTSSLPLADNSTDKIFLILSAHEIRDTKERILFFKEVKRILRKNGKIIVTEHLRDTVNFLAYNIGFFHFHSKSTWYKTFHGSGLKVANEIKVTPFITTFILEKDGNTA